MASNKSNKAQSAREHVFKKSVPLDSSLPKVKGYNFDNDFNIQEFLKAYSNMGAQATNLGKAIQIIKEMKKEKAFTYLGYTSSMVSSGLRDIFRYLVQNKQVDVLVTTAGGIEEDLMKCLGDFKIGTFRVSGKKLREQGINRIGNIFVENELYCKFEDFAQPILEELYQEQIKNNTIVTPSKLIWKLGEKINNPESICYWSYKNKIPIYCPAITDGAIGDQIYFFKSKHHDFRLDVIEDIVSINNSTMNKKKTGVIILGSGVIKHHILNANLFRNGTDYAVYINNAQEHDASDAGALPEEAKAWGKILPDAKSVKVYGDATIIFPLIVLSCFKLS